MELVIRRLNQPIKQSKTHDFAFRGTEAPTVASDLVIDFVISSGKNLNVHSLVEKYV